MVMLVKYQSTYRACIPRIPEKNRFYWDAMVDDNFAIHDLIFRENEEMICE